MEVVYYLHRYLEYIYIYNVIQWSYLYIIEESVYMWDWFIYQSIISFRYTNNILLII